MRILFISAYPAWNKVSVNKMPSQHLYGMHELVDHYENTPNGQLRGILRSDVFDGGYVDFYLWKDGKKSVIKQIIEMKKLGNKYDLFYDSLNRCSIFLGILKKLGLFKTKLLTTMHHPPYRVQMLIANSDGYSFFSEGYRSIAENVCPQKSSKYYINEWMPDIRWYRLTEDETVTKDGFFIDNGKSHRDRKILIEAAEIAKVPVIYAANESDKIMSSTYAAPYTINLKDDFAIARKMRHYHALIIPIQKSDKIMIGPLGVTSFLDAIALNMPIVVSDNVFFSELIEKYQLGIVYETGNTLDLAKAMEKIYYDNEFLLRCKENMKKYADGCSMQKHAQILAKHISVMFE